MIDRRATEDAVKRIVGDHFGLPSALVRLDAALREHLGVEPVDHYELIVTVEERFGIRIPPEQIAALLKVSDIVDCVWEITRGTAKTIDQKPPSKT